MSALYRHVPVTVFQTKSFFETTLDPYCFLRSMTNASWLAREVFDRRDIINSRYDARIDAEFLVVAAFTMRSLALYRRIFLAAVSDSSSSSTFLLR